MLLLFDNNEFITFAKEAFLLLIFKYNLSHKCKNNSHKNHRNNKMNFANIHKIIILILLLPKNSVSKPLICVN